MAAKKREQNPDKITIITPPGTTKWPKLTKPDYGTDAYPDADGSYNTKLVFDRSDKGVQAMLDKMDELMEKASEQADAKFADLPVATRKKLGQPKRDDPYSVVYDEDTEEDTGKVEIRVKMKASGTRKDGTKWTAKPVIVDAGNPPKALKAGIDVYSGSVAIVNFDAEPYFVAGTGAYGITKRLNGAQIVSLVSAGGGRTASSLGFGAVEGGFSNDDVDDEDVSTSTSTDDGSEDDTDF